MRIFVRNRNGMQLCALFQLKVIDYLQLSSRDHSFKNLLYPALWFYQGASRKPTRDSSLTKPLLRDFGLLWDEW